MRYIKIIVIQVLAVLSVRLFDMGVAWTQGELGFHPMAAGAVSVLFILAPYVWATAVDEEY